MQAEKLKNWQRDEFDYREIDIQHDENEAIVFDAVLPKHSHM